MRLQDAQYKIGSCQNIRASERQSVRPRTADTVRSTKSSAPAIQIATNILPCAFFILKVETKRTAWASISAANIYPKAPDSRTDRHQSAGNVNDAVVTGRPV